MGILCDDSLVTSSGVPISQVFGEGALMCAGVPFRETCSKSGVAMRIGHVFGGGGRHYICAGAFRETCSKPEGDLATANWALGVLDDTVGGAGVLMYTGRPPPS